MAPGRRRSISPALAAFLVIAVAVGAAAALLAAPAPPTPPSSVGPSTVPESAVAYVGYAMLAIVALAFARMIYLRVTGQSIAPPRVFVLGVLSIFLVALGFLLVARFAPLSHSTSSPTTGPHGTGTPGPNSTPPPPGNGTPGPFLSAPGLHVPGWAVLVGLGVAVAVVVGFVLPALLTRRAPLPPPAPSVPAREAFARALRALEDDPGTDPRGLIVELYGALLTRIGRRIGGVESRTPREIERAAVGGLGIRPATAGELTGLFEEARYSTHPMTRAAADRARAALRQALADIDQRFPGVG